MRPMSSSSSSGSEIRNWRSPTPYLFECLSVFLIIISLALVILICSKRKHVSHSSAEAEEMKQAIPQNMEGDPFPRILVIMAGDDKPTYLGISITSSTPCTCAVNKASQLTC
ncbi:unnamed protein product [Sphenostylis stenocarpa]|uniref:Uncharacterized protein n=1 Tax=Sphenostylis stenocarpa TaxID=92480 RepID=A0AA86VI24_9FABA|nr:unnamed protein product [Sphenostylis stenocarpa]